MLTNNSCKKNCDPDEQDSNFDKICQKCSLALSNCYQCNQNGTNCTQCFSGYYVGEDTYCHSCTDINQLCLTCTYNSTCTSCKDPYKLTLNECQSQCDKTQQDNDNDTICLNCSVVLKHCATCTQDGLSCTSCQIGYDLGNDSKCHSCTDIDPNCQNCKDFTNCTSCQNPLKLTSNSCKAQCDKNQQDKDGKFICEPCSLVLSQCIECSQDGKRCSLCNQGYFIDDNQICNSCTLIHPNCTSCVNNLTCTSCQNPLKLTSNSCKAQCDKNQQDKDENFICEPCSLVLSQCIECSQDGARCSLCNQGYFTDDNQSCKSCSLIHPNCTYCLNNSTCISCQNPLKLTSNSCKAQCDKNQQDKDEKFICQPCSLVLSQCIECSQDGVNCYYCNQEYFTDDNQTCKSCTLIHPNCTSCFNNLTCTSCQNPLKLTSNSCKAQCDKNQQDKDEKFICQPCSLILSQCIECSQDGVNCYYCNQEYFTDDNQTCKSCTLIHPNCTSCFNNLTCTSCQNPLKLTSNSCKAQCDKNQQDKDEDFICEPCSLVLSQCIECSQDGIKCFSCQQKYFVGSNSLCYSCILIDPQCSTCSDDGICLFCNDNYKLTLNKCKSNCDITQQDQDNNKICENCNKTLENCLQCSEDGYICLKCQQQFFVYNDNKCKSCSSLLAYCSTCLNSLTCTSCDFSHKLSLGKCQDQCDITQQDQDNDGICQNCSQVLFKCEQCSQDGLRCFQCSTGYYFNASLSQCSSCADFSEYCQNCTQQECLSCVTPYKLSQISKTCNQTCPESEQDANNDRFCERCDLILANCLNCNQEGTDCKMCKVGYSLNVNQQCQSCQNSIPFCSSCSQDLLTCLGCIHPYKLFNNSCLDNCQQPYYYDSNYICQPCQKKLYQNDCNEKCPQNTQDFDNDQICQPCSQAIENCQSCYEDLNVLKCDSCFQNYFLVDNNCVTCSEAIQDCTKCQQNNVCLSCKSLLLTKNRCESQCDESEQDYDHNRECQPCSKILPNCNKCNQDFPLCYECMDGFFMQNDTCQSCQQIHQDCIECTDSINCTYCATLKLSQNTCVQKCPQTEQDNLRKRICEPCDQVISNCTQCSENGLECFICQYPLVVSQNKTCQEEQQNEEDQEQPNEEQHENNQTQTNTSDSKEKSSENQQITLDSYNITTQEKQFIEQTQSIQNTIDIVGATCASAASLVASTGTSGGSFFAYMITTELLSTNALINVPKPDILSAFYFQQSQSSMQQFQEKLQIKPQEQLVHDGFLESLGHKSYAFYSNAVLYLLLISTLLCSNLILYLLDKYVVKLKFLTKLRRNYLNYRLAITFYILFSFKIGIASILQLINANFENAYNGINTLAAGFSTILQVSLIVRFIQVAKKYLSIKNQVSTEASNENYQLLDYKAKYLPIFDELRAERKALMFYPLFLVRRFAISVVNLALKEYAIAQLALNISLSLLQISYVVKFKPFVYSIQNKTQILVEIFLLTFYSSNFYFYFISKTSYQRRLEVVWNNEAETLAKAIILMSTTITFAGLGVCYSIMGKSFEEEIKAFKKGCY